MVIFINPEEGVETTLLPSPTLTQASSQRDLAGKVTFRRLVPSTAKLGSQKFWKQTGHLLPLGPLDFIRAVVRIQMWDEGSPQAPRGAWRTQTHPFIPQIPSVT